MDKVLSLDSPSDLKTVRRDLESFDRIQISACLKDAEFRELGEALELHPNVTFRVFGFDKKLATLEFLKFFPRLRRFSLAGLHHASDLTPLKYLPEDLEFLDIGETASALDLAPVANFRELKELRIASHRKGIAKALSVNRSLRALALWRLPVDKVLPELDLPDLESLALTLGSTGSQDWYVRFAGLRYIALRSVRGLSDVGPVCCLAKLEWLWLDDLPKVSNLPDLVNSSKLLRVDLTAMKGIRQVDSLKPLARAPKLRELLISESRLPVEAFEVLAKRKGIERIGVGLGSARRNDQASALLARDWPAGLKQFADEHHIPLVV